MKNNISSIFKSLLFLMLVFARDAGASSFENSNELIRLREDAPNPIMSNATFINNLESHIHIPLSFVLPLRNPEELHELIERLYDPADQEYQKYLTTEEFIDRFAPTQEDYDKVVKYAKSVGFKLRSTHPNRTLVNFSAPAHTIESAFNLHLNQYVLPNGRYFYAPDKNPEVPRVIASIISGVIGLDNGAKWRPFYRQKEIPAENANAQTFPSGPHGGFSPNDLVTAYNLSSVSADGTNEIIALFELADYKKSDISAYTNYFGLPSPKLKKILVDGGSGTGIDAEVTLDIELALALAPQSSVYVYEGPNTDQGVLNTYNRIATDNFAKQVSTSWGIGEGLVNASFLRAENAIFKQMAVQGQTIYAAAGDSGAYDNYPSSSKTLMVDDPASQPYIVGVGGTKLLVNAATGAYESELVWNNGLGKGAGGGGVSGVWPIPSWQTQVSTLYSKTQRNVPDVALNADPNTGYAIYYKGQWQIFGGTSCAAPLWAAFTARVNQELSAAQKPALGFANPTFYAIGNGSTYLSNFYDVVTGNNLYYQANVGYDNASGWGSFNGANLFTSLTKSVEEIFLSIILKHNAPFAKGKTGTYRIVVSNTGTSSTTGPVNVAVTLPMGLSYQSFSGQGWTFNSNAFVFTDSNPLTPGSSYPTIVLNVNVDANAPAMVIPTATVSSDGAVPVTVSNLTTTH